MTDHDEVLDAARALVEAFGRHDTAAYFSCFAPEATFLFHTHDEPLRSRGAYEDLWAAWEREDEFRVVECVSTDQHVQLLGETAIFTHRVRTVVRAAGTEDAVDERETIVFHRDRPGHWTAVHEHLSPLPAPTA